MQKRNKSLGMQNDLQFGWEIFTSSLVTYITVDFQKLVSDLFHTILIESECIKTKNEATRIAPKHNNSLETFPFAIQKIFAMHQSDLTLQIPRKKSVVPIKTCF